ncbi:MAG TPA: DUF1844 domain-containing protein [Polyangiaceae bacterium]|jgi:hypothetical protein|nr:DUF1844 domain-containing protein [Polyangiaceae bacterium]
MSDEQRTSPEEDPSESQYREAEGSAGSELPAVDFSTLVLSLSHSVLLHLGDAPDPSDGQSHVNLPMARQTIDLLTLLQDKTRGNLTGPEESLLAQALYDLRLRYVEVARPK